MIAVWVQLVRNFLCCVKSLHTSPTSFLNSKPLDKQIGLFSPKTTVIEFGIASLQFAAVIFNFQNCYSGVINGLTNYHESTKNLILLDRLSFTKSSGFFTVLRHFLANERYKAIHEIITGALCFVLGAGFIFLTMNSLHIDPPSHPKPVYDALIAHEICLIYFLVIMWKSFIDKFIKHIECHHIQSLIQHIDSQENMSEGLFLSLLLDHGFENRMHDGLNLIDYTYPTWSKNNTNLPTQRIEKELETIKTFIHTIVAKSVKSKKVRENLCNGLDLTARYYLNLAPLELIYFLLNIIAGYGYMIGILTFYIPHTPYTLPLWLKFMYLGLTPAQADWWGNFMGDLAWTIEPAIILYMTYITPLLKSTTTTIIATDVNISSTTTTTTTTSEATSKVIVTPTTIVKDEIDKPIKKRKSITGKKAKINKDLDNELKAVADDTNTNSEEEEDHTTKQLIDEGIKQSDIGNENENEEEDDGEDEDDKKVIITRTTRKRTNKKEPETATTTTTKTKESDILTTTSTRPKRTYNKKKKE